MSEYQSQADTSLLVSTFDNFRRDITRIILDKGVDNVLDWLTSKINPLVQKLDPILKSIDNLSPDDQRQVQNILVLLNQFRWTESEAEMERILNEANALVDALPKTEAVPIESLKIDPEIQLQHMLEGAETTMTYESYRDRFQEIVDKLESKRSLIRILLPELRVELTLLLSLIANPLENEMGAQQDLEKPASSDFIGRIKFLESFFQIQKKVYRGSEHTSRSVASSLLEEIAKADSAHLSEIQAWWSNLLQRVQTKLAEKPLPRQIDDSIAKVYLEEKKMLQLIIDEFANLGPDDPQFEAKARMVGKALRSEPRTLRN